MSVDRHAQNELTTDGQHKPNGAILAPEASAATAPHPNDEAANKERRDIRAWQRKLLPWMLGFLICVASFFLIATIYEFNYLNTSILSTEQAPSVSKILPSTLDSKSSAYQTVAQLEIAAELEAYVLQQRYHQANIAEMSRVWLQYLGFETGMILALVGAFFILGKITDVTSSNLAVSWKEVVNTSLVTSSPGLVLAAFGVILMAITIVIHHDIAVTDAAIYIRGPNMAVTNPMGAAGTPPPLEPPADSTPMASPATVEAVPSPSEQGN